MSEVERIADQLKRAYEGPAWHGPALRQVLDRVGHERAAARPVPGAHRIWEIVLHVAAWEGIVRRRLEGEVFGVEEDGEEDWPPVGEAGEAAWGAALAALHDGHMALRRTILAFPDARLGEPVGGRPESAYVLMHGAIQHDLYHAGQIAILGKG